MTSKTAGRKNPMLMETLSNLDVRVNSNTAFARGTLIGVVGTLMAVRGYTLEAALDAIKPNLPDAENINWLAVPECWDNELLK